MENTAAIAKRPRKSIIPLESKIPPIKGIIPNKDVVKVAVRAE